MQGSGFHKGTHCFCSYLVHFVGFSCLVKNSVFLKISSQAFSIFRFTTCNDFLTNLASRGSFFYVCKVITSVWPFCCSLNETEESLRVRRTPWKLMIILVVITLN